MKHFVLTLISSYVFIYPVIMAFVWMAGGVFFFFRRERQQELKLEQFPMFSIIVPCHNEEETIEDTIACLLALDYPNYEIIVVDDGSNDATAWIVEGLLKESSKIRLVKFTENQGKSVALNTGILVSNGEIVMCVDADALVERQALKRIAWHFVKFPRVGAVTGNPRVINRSSLLAKIQVGEYSTIIGLIKRTQRLLGKILTVSGVIAAYRKSALFRVGLFDNRMYTEDIDMTWKLQKDFWDIRYEPQAVCWIFVPETLKGLLKQRIRWACGGIQVLLKHWDIWKKWRFRRLWPIYVEYLLDILWAYGLGFLLVSEIFVSHFHSLLSPLWPPRWVGAILASLCLIQFFIGIFLEQRYEKRFYKYFFWVIWYPFVYWLLGAIAIIYATPKAIWSYFKKECAFWKSPDRGLRKVVR